MIQILKLNLGMNIETAEKPKQLCENLLGLYFTSPDETGDRYVHAFSFSKDILENMIANNVKEEEQKYYSVHPIEFYMLIEWNTSDNKRHTMVNLEKWEYSDIQYPIYGYNSMYMSKGCILCKQVLLSTNKIVENIISSISSNPIQIDTFYEEGILNA